MFGVTLRTNFNDLRPSYNDNARPQYQPQPQDAILQHSVVANQLTLLKYNAGLADPQIQAKGDTLYVTGEQVKYRDSREGIIRANRIVMNDLPDGIKTIRITENRLNMPQVTTETDVASLKNHLAGEPLGHETKLAANLSNALFDAGVMPYYLHVLDKVQGAAHFMVSDDEARQIMRELLTLVSGYLVPKLAREIGGEPSKTPLDLQLRQQ